MFGGADDDTLGGEDDDRFYVGDMAISLGATDVDDAASMPSCRDYGNISTRTSEAHEHPC